MRTITLNSTELTITMFSRHTDIMAGVAREYIVLNFGDNSQYDDLVHIGVINSFVVKVDGETVYSMDNITANITSVNEELNNDGVIVMDATIYLED